MWRVRTRKRDVERESEKAHGNNLLRAECDAVNYFAVKFITRQEDAKQKTRVVEVDKKRQRRKRGRKG